MTKHRDIYNIFHSIFINTLITFVVQTERVRHIQTVNTNIYRSHNEVFSGALFVFPTNLCHLSHNYIIWARGDKELAGGGVRKWGMV